jgi:uncharacterized membrane protein YhaH (DUF805 family)
MTEQASILGRYRRASFLGGRFNRKTYWAGVGAMMAISVVLTLLKFKGSAGTTGVLLFLLIRRLHDFNRTGWWALAILLAPIVPMLALMPIAPTMALPVATLFSLIWVVWVGVIPGDPFENRFGAPMGGQKLDDVFS